MSDQETVFTYEYHGTKEHFLEDLNSQFNNNTARGYLLERKENGNFFLGVERAGHSGGNWYVANVTEENGKTQITGKIVYNPDENGQERKSERKSSIKDTIGIVIMFILLLPIVIFGCIALGIWFIIDKIKTRNNKEASAFVFISKEEKLDKFMLEYLNCKKI